MLSVGVAARSVVRLSASEEVSSNFIKKAPPVMIKRKPASFENKGAGFFYLHWWSCQFYVGVRSLPT